MSVVHEDHVDVHGPCGILMWVAYTAIQGLGNVCHLGCPQGPCLGLWAYCNLGLRSWSALSPETMWKPMIRAPPDSKVQESYFCSNIDGCRCIVKKEGHTWKTSLSNTILTPTLKEIAA